MHQALELISQEFSLEEIGKYKREIMKKTHLNNQDFVNEREQLAIAIAFIPLEDYQDCLKQALTISPDRNDVDFFALAIKLKCALWSNDKLLKKQDTIRVFDTGEVIRNVLKGRYFN